MWHPVHHHRHIHMCYHACYDWYVPNLYWHGYWSYARLHAYNQVVVYVRGLHPSTDILSVATSDLYVYTLYRDNILNKVYFTITDNTDNIVVKTEVHRRYNSIVVDENGIWILRDNGRKPMYFIYNGVNLYRYVED